MFYKVFAYMVLARIEPALEAAQPEEQNGFRSGRRLEEHVVTAFLISQTTHAIGKPVWAIGLDL